MDGLLQFIKEYGFFLMFIGQVGMGILLLYFKDKFAGKHIEQGHEDLKDRVSIIETQMEQLPSKDALHSLELKISELRGDLKRVDESLVNVEKFSKIAHAQIGRIDEFLKRAP